MASGIKREKGWTKAVHEDCNRVEVWINLTSYRIRQY
jgi:hypothetical protein